MYEMMSGAPPFYSKDKTQMFKNILEVSNLFLSFFFIYNLNRNLYQ